MPQIRSLFDVSRALNRPIEKVITYQNRGDAQLRTEVSEYVVTDNINENFQRLLKGVQSVLQGGGGYDIGVWVSGFYGSGKSSFTKYLGFALDRGMKLGSDSFLQLLKNRITDSQVPALFNQVPWLFTIRLSSFLISPVRCLPAPRWKTSLRFSTSRFFNGPATQRI
jgi:hypothetical protein